MSTGDRRRDGRDDQFERKPSHQRYDPPEILDVLPVPDGYGDKQLGELVEQFRFTGRLRWLRYGSERAQLRCSWHEGTESSVLSCTNTACFIYRGHSSARTTRPGDREPAREKTGQPISAPRRPAGQCATSLQINSYGIPKLRYYLSFAGTFANRHPLPRHKMCDAWNIRQNAGVAGIVFSGKNGNGSRAAKSKQRQKNLPPPPKKRLQIAAH